MKLRGDDTIAAIATPLGEGALAVVRISGPAAISIADSVFRGRSPLQSAAGYTVHHGLLVAADGGEVDEVLATVFRAPHSYTGEDAVELSCHGGAYVGRKVLELLLAAGARQADPGEFTKRAFLNSKMDLTQAEAVAELIHAGGEAAHRNSLRQLEGLLGRKIRSMKEDLTNICALLELELDFSEEGLELVSRSEVVGRISRSLDDIQSLISSFSSGKIIRDGVSVALVGPPNAGKSSIFNALLLQDRAIVTPIAGTTRDTIEESYEYRGVVFNMTDTAGLRESEDPVESEGILRTKNAVMESDVVCIVLDAANETSKDFMHKSADALQAKKRVIVLNKVDLAPAAEFAHMDVRTSAKTGHGIEALRESIFSSMFTREKTPLRSDSVVITSRRHFDALTASKLSLTRGLDCISAGHPNELVAVDIREAINSLGEIVGEVTSDDVLNRIFGSFCIGK